VPVFVPKKSPINSSGLLPEKRLLIMAESEFLGDRRRQEEERYFREQEAQFIQKLRQRRDAEEARRRHG
jgi:hypothetical protein